MHGPELSPAPHRTQGLQAQRSKVPMQRLGRCDCRLLFDCRDDYRRADFTRLTAGPKADGRFNNGAFIVCPWLRVSATSRRFTPVTQESSAWPVRGQTPTER